jgi:signal transduction histidine kinase
MIHVLHAEDDPVVCTFVGECFARAGLADSLELVGTGRECLERMARGGVDVLLLDLKLPDIDGLHVLGELAMRGDSTPVVIVSAHGQTKTAVEALRAGAVDCVDKGSGQFFQIAEIAGRVYEQHQAESAGSTPLPARTRKPRVLFIEAADDMRKVVRTFFADNATQIELQLAGATDELDRLLTHGIDAEGVIIGRPPGGADPLQVLRDLRAQVADLPIILIASGNDAEMAVAAFKFGALDYITRQTGYLPRVVFSLAHGLRRAELARHNARLSSELLAVNRSLEAQVKTRVGEVRTLSMRLLNLQEKERREIARELHDQIGQMLTGLTLQLESAALEAAMPLKTKLIYSYRLARDVLDRTREITLQLRPNLLDDLGLRSALAWHLELFQRQTSVQVATEISLSDAPLPSEVETAIFRVVQEALTNVARHSDSTTASVTIVENDSQVLVEVSDPGCGFDAGKESARPESIGLAGMAERVHWAGGEIEIVSSPGKGTRIQAAFPRPITPKLP